MTDLTAGWKLFRVICIIQMIVVSLELILSVGGLFNQKFFFYSLFSTLIYFVILIFLYQGLSLINYNYPDTPLSPRQKKSFNWLYLLNFLLIAFLFGQIVNEWRTTIPIWLILDEANEVSLSDYLFYGYSFLIAILLFIFHIIFLGGMYNLRRLIYQNTIETWKEQFTDSKKI